MSDETIDKEISKGFLAGLLGDVPGFVRGILATMFGTTICLVAMLQLGGLQVPVTNWLTSQMAPQVKDLRESVVHLQLIVSRIEAAESRIGRGEQRLIELEKVQDTTSRDVIRIKRQLGLQ